MQLVVKKLGNIVTFFVLAFLLLLNSTSREFVHEFAHHQDTIDHCQGNYHTANHAAFESEHHHCDFLNFLVPVYHPIEENFQLDFFQQVITPLSLDVKSFYSKEKEHTSLRGPPLC